MLPFTVEKRPDIDVEDALVIPHALSALEAMEKTISALIVKADGKVIPIELSLAGLEETERDIITAGCLMNYYNKTNKN